jgi:tetratricopeptide (TPR) repeat protein
MIEILEMTYEIWNFLVRHKIEVAFSILIAIISGVFVNYIWDWLKAKSAKRRRTAEIFEVYKKTKHLTPKDFRIAEYRSYYYERKEDEKIREALSQGKSVLVIGRPKAGKTRAAYEAVKHLKGFKVVKFWEKLLDFEKIPKSVKKGNNVLVFDDLNKFVDKVNLYEVVKKFTEKSKRAVVVTTCRSGKEFEEVEEKFSDVLRDFVRVECGDVSEKEAKEIAKDAGIKFKSFDGTIGSVFLGLDVMRMRFEEEPEECKSLFRVLKLLHDAGIFLPRKILVEEIYRRKLEIGRISASMSIESALEKIERDSFIFMFKEFQVIRERHESYLDFAGYLASVDDFRWLKGILVELKDESGLFCLGNAFYGRELFESGIKCYDESLELKENADAYSNRGVAYADLNQNERAIEDYNKAIGLNPNYAEAYINRGNAYADLNQNERAIEDYNKAIELNPNYAVAYINRGNAYADLNQNERAIEDYNKAIELNPNYTEAYNNRGIAYADLNQNERAIEDYNKAIELNPNYAVPYHNRGNAYAKLNQNERAIEDYNKAIGLNPNYTEAYNNRGTTYVKLKYYNKAIKDYNKAIGLNPKYAMAYYNRGSAYADLNQNERAIEDYNKARELNPNDPKVYNNRGTTYVKLKYYNKAIKDYNKAIELNPNYAEAYYNRGRAYTILNKHERAIEDYNKAIELNPNLAEAYGIRGLAYAKLNKPEKAIEDYNKAIELNPNLAEAYWNRGFAYSKIGGYEESARNLKNAGILFLYSGREDDAGKAFSVCFNLRDKIDDDDVIYCGLARYFTALDPDVIIALRRMRIQNENLRKTYKLTLKKLQNEDISEEITSLEEKEKREEMKILLELLKRF